MGPATKSSSIYQYDVNQKIEKRKMDINNNINKISDLLTEDKVYARDAKDELFKRFNDVLAKTIDLLKQQNKSKGYVVPKVV